MKRIHRLSRRSKRLIMVGADITFVPLAMWSAFALRLGQWSPDFSVHWWLLVAAPFLGIPIFIRLGLYRAVVRFMGSQVVFAVLKGVTLSTLVLAAVTLLLGVKGVPRSVFGIYWALAILYIGGSRYFVRAYFQALSKTGGLKRRVVIYGAGASGAQLASILAGGNEFEPVAFIDDNRTLQGSYIHGVPVYAPKDIGELISDEKVESVLLAMPSASRARRREVINSLELFPVHVQTIPGISDLISGKASFDEIREVDIEDLLGRDSVAPNTELLDACIKGKSVLVTGAGGSIGSELCRQIVRLRPRRLILLELSEYALYQIQRELKSIAAESGVSVQITALLGNVQDSDRMESVFKAFSVDTIYHAAAYKHVPMVEHNATEGVANNALGTWQAAEAAIAAKVPTFVLISTDKAVRPTNVMGASKRLAELVLQGLNQRGESTRFCMVRFGNVLGSSGSVVPLFREQIHNGGPITVTHPDIIRYFMTIPEAAQLVIQAGSMGTGGDVFVLDMGEPVKIADLARKMVHLMGLEVRDEKNPNGDIAIEYTGLRPGEKLYEELLIGNNVSGTRHPLIMRAQEAALPWAAVEGILTDLRTAIVNNDCERIRQLLLGAVDGYAPNGNIEDELWQQLGRKKVTVIPFQEKRELS